MKCEVNREAFAECLKVAACLIPTRTTYPVLNNVVLEVKGSSLTVSATDLDTHLQKSLPVENAEVGRVMLPGRKLHELVSELSESRLVISQVNTNVKFESGKNTYTFAGLDPEEYPEVPPMPSEQEFVIPLPLLDTAFDATAFAVARDDSRVVMTGINWEIAPGEVRMVATDGHRLAYFRSGGEFGTKAKMIVSTKIAPLVARGEEIVRVRCDSSRVGLEAANTIVVSRLIEGPYPDYERVIPKSHTNLLKAKRDVLATALRRAAVFAGPVIRPVSFDLKPGDCQVLAETSELGQAQEILGAEYKGAPIKTTYNASFILEILKHIPSDDVVIELGAPDKPGVIKPDVKGADRLYLLMPIRTD